MTNNGQKFLKITSILMIIGGIIAAIAGVIAILGVSALAALAGNADGTGLLYAATAAACFTAWRWRWGRGDWSSLRQFHPCDDHLGD